MTITQAKLKELLHYDPETGAFTNLVTRGRKVQRGSVIRNRCDNRYRLLMVDGYYSSAHRLAWLYVHGYLPEGIIDHKDQNPGNNKLENLREVTHACNMRNVGNRSNNTSGVKGVCWNTGKDKWEVGITINCKGKYLCGNSDFTEAVAHRLAAEQCLDWAGCDNNSPAYAYMQNYLKEKR